MFQKVLGSAVLAIGVVYAAVILRSLVKNREEFERAPGTLPLTGIAEFIVYAVSSVGISDFLLNTLTCKKFRLCEDRDLPGTMVGCTVVPSSIIAFALLFRSGEGTDLLTLLLCGAAVMIGSVMGSRFVGGMDGTQIRRIMRIALVASLVFLIVKIVVSSGAAGTEGELRGWKLALAVVLCLGTGVVNMFGIPMKPTWTAIFLIMGLAPLTVLTMVLVLGAMTPLLGAVEVVRSGRYQKKLVGSAVVTGSAGAVAGVLTAVTIPGNILNIILIAVMLIAIVAMFRK